MHGSKSRGVSLPPPLHHWKQKRLLGTKLRQTDVESQSRRRTIIFSPGGNILKVPKKIMPGGFAVGFPTTNFGGRLSIQLGTIR